MAPNEKPLWCLCNFKIIYNSNEGLISTKRQKGTAPRLGGEKRVGFPFLDIIKEITLPSGDASTKRREWLVVSGFSLHLAAADSHMETHGFGYFEH